MFLCPIVLDVLHRQLLLGGDSAVSPPCNGHNYTPFKDEVETYRREQAGWLAGWMESLTPTTVSRQNKNLDLKFTLKISSHRKSNVFKRAFLPHIELHQLLGIPLLSLTLKGVVQHKHKQVLSPHTFSHT